MHLVDTIGGEGYAVVFVEPEEGQETDPRLTDAKRKELERIAKCCSAQEVLEVSPGSSPALVKKTFLKKSLMVHPDKNAFGGATEAMKILSSAVHAIEKGDARWRPPRFVVGGAAKELPQISRFLQAKRSHFREDVVKMAGGLGFRVAAESKADTDNAGARDFLERAWKSGTIVRGGVLEADKSYSIDSVRFKEKRLLSDGNLNISLETVKQKALQGAAEFQTFPEMDVKCPALAAVIEALRTCPSSESERARALDLFRELVTSTNNVAAKLVQACNSRRLQKCFDAEWAASIACNRLPRPRL